MRDELHRLGSTIAVAAGGVKLGDSGSCPCNDEDMVVELGRRTRVPCLLLMFVADFIT